MASDNSNNNNGCISLTIPKGAEEGDVLTFQVNGQELEIAVPVGSQPGDVLSLQIGNDNDGVDNGEEKDSGTTQVDLGNGSILELALRLPQELQDESTHKNAADTTTSHNTVDDGTYALPWQSGKELSKVWNEIPFPRVPKRILELGSGALGLAGLSFGVCLQEQLLEAKSKLVLTDVQSAMPLLQYNIEQVQTQGGLSQDLPIQAKPLEWTMERPDGDENEQYYDCILGSDLLYNAKFIPHLVATTKRLLHPTRGMFILAARWRKPELERDFFQESGLEWKLIQPSSGNLPCTLEWKEFGDPQKDKSNLYFYQTQVSVQGKPKALAEISEEESGKLGQEEFEAWDRAHIQIYMGTQPKTSA